MNRAILALADDMTGALETGAMFASAGFRTVVSARESGFGDAEALVLDTESRHLSPGEAAARVESLARAAGRAEWIYKKTDSTLRGNIAAELAALAQLFPQWRIGYAPAYPAQGRTVKDAVVLVDGVPVHETEFARDALNPVATSDVRALLGPDLPCVIFDGEGDEDVARAAAAMLAEPLMRIAAGPAAFAGALAELLGHQLTDAQGGISAIPTGIRTCLLVNGSRHKASGAQVLHAKFHGCVSTMEESRWMLAAETARQAAQMLARRRDDAVFVMGGDTAFALVVELGNPPLAPIGEVLAGVAVSRIAAADLPGRGSDLFLISKAGGFGAEDVVCRVRQILEKRWRITGSTELR